MVLIVAFICVLKEIIAHAGQSTNIDMGISSPFLRSISTMRTLFHHVHYFLNVATYTTSTKARALERYGNGTLDKLSMYQAKPMDDYLKLTDSQPNMNDTEVGWEYV